MSDFNKDFVPWKGTGSTENLNAVYNAMYGSGFAPGDIVTASSTNAALRMTTLICSAIANLYQLNGLDIDSTLGSVIAKMKENANLAFGSNFNYEMTFNRGAVFNIYPLTINDRSQIILQERSLPVIYSSTDVDHLYDNYNFGIGNAYTIDSTKDQYEKGFESKFYLREASYENQVYCKVAYHSFLDMLSTGSTLTQENSTVFEIQRGKDSPGNAIFYIRPNGTLTCMQITVTNGDLSGATRPEIRILPAVLQYVEGSSGVPKTITWKDLFAKLDKIT